MLKDLAYPDMGVIDELRNGFDLTGDVPVTGMLPGWTNPSTALYGTRTLEEVEQGYLAGPFSLEDVGECEPISRRFGLKQKDKVRPIDDFFGERS